MKKIYLLFLLSLLSIPGFCGTRWYAVVPNGDMTQNSTWNSSSSRGGFSPVLPASPGDTFVVDVPVYLPNGGKFYIYGSLMFQIGNRVLREGANPDTMDIGGSLIFAGTAGYYGYITSVAGAGSLTMYVDSNLYVDGASFITDSTTQPTTINLKGELDVEGGGFISSNSGGNTTINMLGGVRGIPAPYALNWTSAAQSSYTNIHIEAADSVTMTGNVNLPVNPIAANILDGTLYCNTYGFYGNNTQSFHIDSGAYLYTANAGGMDSTIQMCTDTFSYLANYVFDGTIPQVTGITMPDSIHNTGSVTINNAAGVTLSSALHFGPTAGYYYGGGPTLNLELGTFKIGISDSILSLYASRVYVDTGTLSSSPVYDGGNGYGGVVVLYENLGYNALAVTTGYELLPVSQGWIEGVEVQKTGATISLGSSVVTGGVSLVYGTLDASPSGYNITLYDSMDYTQGWGNFSGANAFIPRWGTVTFATSPLLAGRGSITGSYPTTFNNLIINDTPGVALIDNGLNILVNDTLSLVAGNLYIYQHNVTLGDTATIAGSPSATSMIVADSTGKVIKGFTADGSFTFPVGDSTNYTPITLSYSGSGGYDSGAYAWVNLRPAKAPRNADTDNYIARYWNVSDSGIVAASYTASATYVPGDVAGTEGDIAAAEIGGSLPWHKFGVTDVATHTLTFGIITDSIAQLTGMDSSAPTVTVSGDTALCLGGMDTLRVLAATGDTPLAYAWSPAAGLSATTGTMVIATPTVTTTYTVTVTDANGTSGTDTVRITVNPVPTLDSAFNNGPVCSGGTVQLIGANPENVTNFVWQGPFAVTDSASDTAMLVSADTTATGIYTVTVTDGIGSGCTAIYYDTVKVNPLPGGVTVTGGGAYCDTNTIFATLSGGDAGTIYFEDTNSLGTSATTAATSALVSYVGTHTYYFRAQNTLGCWGPQDSAIVTINALPLPDTAFGGGVFCDSTVITSSNGDSGTIYFQGTTPNGTSTSLGGTPQTIADSGTFTYYFRALSAAGCWGAQDSVTVTIHKTPDTVAVTGSGTFCGLDSISATGGMGGAIYYEYDTSGDTNIYLGSGSYQYIATSGTYYFRAMSNGCWGSQDSAVVVINPLPATVTITTPYPATGTGNFCDTVTVLATNGGDGIIYYEDTSSMGTLTTAQDTTMVLYAGFSGNVHFRALNAVTGCWSYDDSLGVAVDSLPDTINVTGGGGPFCGSAQLTAATTEVSSTVFIYSEGNAPGGTTIGVGGPSPYSLTVDTTGVYYFRAYDNSSSCWSREGVSTDSAGVLINPLPPIHNVTGGGSRCVGGSGLDLQLDGSDTGISYQLFNDTGMVAVDTPFGGSGFGLDFGTDTNAGTFVVIATNTATGCKDTTAGATVIVNPLPGQVEIYPQGNSLFCANGTGINGAGIDVTADSTDPFVNYTFYADGTPVYTQMGIGGAVDFGDFTDTGTYVVVAQNANTGCLDTMLNSIHLGYFPLPGRYLVSGGGTMCASDTGFHIFLSGSDTGITYSLYGNWAIPALVTDTGTGNGLNFGLLDPSPNTTAYTVIAASAATTCSDTMSDTVQIIVNPLPLSQTMGGGGSYCAGSGGLPVFLDGSEAGVSYQLFHNGVADGLPVAGTGSGVSFPNQTANGIYDVVATNMTTGCIFDTIGYETINTDSLPDIYHVFGGGSYCTGGIGFNIGLSSTQSGAFEYTLYNDRVTVSSIIGTGTLDSFGRQTLAGTYIVTAQEIATGCTDTMSGSATIAISPLPGIDTVTGGGSYCSGGTGVAIDLNSSTAGFNYQLYRGGTLVSGSVAGTSLPLYFGTYTTSGVYKVTATNAVTGCVSNMADSAIISVSPLPAVYAITGGGSYCTGGSGVEIGLSGSQTGVDYQLYLTAAASGDSVSGSGFPFTFGLRTAAGSYLVIATDSATHCTDSMSGRQTIAINPLPAAYTVLGGGSYCIGSPGVDVSLSHSDDGSLYLLYEGSTTVGPPLGGDNASLDFGLQTLTGVYKVVAVDTTTTCADTMTGSVTVTADSLLVPVVSVTAYPGTDVGVGSLDTMVATVTGAGTGATCQWYVNGNLVPGATHDTFSFDIYYNTDSITCQVTSHGSCGGYTTSRSVFITLHNVGVGQVSASAGDIKLIPNPNKGAFTIRGTLGTTTDEEVSIEVTDMLGQAIYEDKVMTTGGAINKQVQLSSSIANGMYLLNLRSGGQNNVFHFVVEQ